MIDEITKDFDIIINGQNKQGKTWDIDIFNAFKSDLEEILSKYHKTAIITEFHIKGTLN